MRMKKKKKKIFEKKVDCRDSYLIRLLWIAALLGIAAIGASLMIAACVSIKKVRRKGESERV